MAAYQTFLTHNYVLYTHTKKKKTNTPPQKKTHAQLLYSVQILQHTHKGNRSSSKPSIQKNVRLPNIFFQ